LIARDIASEGGVGLADGNVTGADIMTIGKREGHELL
jgi:hypothetical protein